MATIALVFDTEEVYGKQLAPLIEAMLARTRSKEDVAFNALNVNRAGLDAVLAEPFYRALAGQGTATLSVKNA